MDPHTGTLAPVRPAFAGEVVSPMWTPDGKIVAVGREYNFTLWKFRASGK
jgi:hypothetical protein